ncbi:MAG: MATE family efflux transporter, partial [Halobaculum sp.]
MSLFDLSSEEITSEPLYRVIPILAAPLLAQNVVRVANRVIDLFFVGRLSGDAVAALGIATPVFVIANIVIIGLPFFGTQIVASQRVGAGDDEEARRATFNGLLLSLALGAGVGGVVWIAAPALMDLLTSVRPDAPENGPVVRMAVDYLRVIVLGYWMAAMSDTLEAALIARGDSRGPFLITVVTVVTSIVLDPFLIFGIGPFPALGVAGAAAASVASFAASLALASYYAFTGRQGGIVSREAATVSLPDLREMVDNAWPPTAQRANEFVADAAMVVIVFAAGGPAGVAAYVVGTRVFAIASIPGFGIETASQSVVGQNLGSEQPDRAARTGVVGGVFLAGLLTPIAVLQWFGAGTIISILAPDLSGAGFADATLFLRVLAYSYPAVGGLYALRGVFNGAGKSRISFYSSILQYWVVQTPVAAAVGIFLISDLGLVFWAYSGAKVATAAAIVGYFVYATRTR